MSANALLPTSASHIKYEALSSSPKPTEKIEIVISPQNEVEGALAQAPADILLLIFDRVLQDSLKNINDYLQRVTLQKVCKRWRNFLVNPSFEKRFWCGETSAGLKITNRKEARNTLGKLIVLNERRRIEAEIKALEAFSRKAEEGRAALALKAEKKDKKVISTLVGSGCTIFIIGSIAGLIFSTKDAFVAPIASLGAGIFVVVVGTIGYGKCKKS